MDSFFESIQRTDIKKYQREWEDLMFILINEFHWTQEQIWDTEIPFIIMLIKTRNRFHKLQDKQLKKLGK